MNKVILIHGIGDAKKGWHKRHKIHEILNIPEQDVIPFNYEHILEDSITDTIGDIVIRLAMAYYGRNLNPKYINVIWDYLGDIGHYAAVRKKIHKKLVALLKEHPESLVIGHSLGSMIAYEVFKNYHGLEKNSLLLIGSPLGSRLKVLNWLIWNVYIKAPDHEFPPIAKQLLNVYSKYDFALSGPIDKFTVDHNIDANNIIHTDFANYVKAAVPFLDL